MQTVRPLTQKEVAFLEKEGILTDTVMVVCARREYYTFWPDHIFIAYVDKKHLCNGEPKKWTPACGNKEVYYSWEESEEELPKQEVD